MRKVELSAVTPVNAFCNILKIYFRVESDLIVKITDNSLSRDLFPNDYNCLGDNENRPVKWLAVEAILNKFFSPASDVVSLRVVQYHISSIIRQSFSFQNNPKNLDPSYKMDLGFWDCSGMVSLIL